MDGRSAGCNQSATSMSSDKHMAVSKRRWSLYMAAMGVIAVTGVRQDLFAIDKRTKEKTNPTSLNPTEELGTLCSNRNAVGVGLRGEYFVRDHWRGEPLLVRTDGILDSNILQFSQSIRSVRWRGWVKASVPGPHRFHFDHPRSRIIVAGSDFSLHVDSPAQPIDLSAGRFYEIALELPLRNKTDAIPFRLEWTPPHGYRYPIAQTMLYLPTN
jgi:hypothetical protein